METGKDLDSVRSAISAIDTRISFLQKNMYEIKKNIRALENLGLVMLISSVVIFGSLHLQISNLSRDIAELDLHINHAISEFSDRNELVPRDFRNLKTSLSSINSRLDAVINTSNSKTNAGSENPE